jgi:hypothetical protein
MITVLTIQCCSMFHSKYEYFSCGLICWVHWLHSCLKNLWKSCVLCSPVLELWEWHKIHPSVPMWVLWKSCVLCSPVLESWEWHKIHPSVPMWVLVKGKSRTMLDLRSYGECRNIIMWLLARNLIILFCLSFSKKGTDFSGLSCMFKFCAASFCYGTNEIPTSLAKLLLVTFPFSCHIFVVDGRSGNWSTLTTIP